MSEIKLQLLIESEPPKRQEEKSKAPCKPSVEERIRDLIECIDSGYDSEMEWIQLNKFYNSLQRVKKSNPRINRLKQMIEPLLAKFGYHKVSAKAHD